MNKNKAVFLMFVCVVSLCVAAVQPVQSQTLGAVYILSDGTVQSTLNATVPIQQNGSLYSFTADLVVYSLIIQKSSITIDGAGFSLSGEGDRGIDLSSASSVTVKDVELSGMFVDGVYISGTSYHTITGCMIANNGNGISLYSSTQNNVTDNDILGNDIGINLMQSTNNLFRSNKLDNTHNIAVYGTQASHYVNDMDDSNIIGDNKKVYYLVNEKNLFMTAEDFPDVGFLALVNCDNITVYGMTLPRNVNGILLAFTTGSTIARCTITGNFAGIMLFGSSGNVIGENVISENTRGIQLSMFSTSNNLFSNSISDNLGAIFLYNSSQNSITGNNITDNNYYAIGLSASSYNIIRSNYFINNGEQVYDASTTDSTVAPSVNTWYVTYPVGGNYWSDYTGVDVKSGSSQDEAGSDQIGDTPYVINSNNQDTYPLMPFGSPIAVTISSPQNKTYVSTSVTLTYTLSKAATWIGYSLDGKANVTINEETTLSGLSIGMHSITVYANDTNGKTGTSETVYFTVSQGSGTTQSEPFPIWILVVIVAVVLVVIVFSFIKIMRKNKTNQ